MLIIKVTAGSARRNNMGGGLKDVLYSKPGSNLLDLTVAVLNIAG